ncbi:GNAT family N-acetyltransferase [Lysinibacillus sp. NPDC048646]|uniref:GNAT family N-acetyltransferase n=1 Tax=Lysinibacillus sp. NPDC048646 TaxID=3390574 RepID=UPI003D031AEB
MEIKLIPPNDYMQVHRLRDYCFPNKYIGARREDFQYWIEQSTTLGAYDGDKVVGQLFILPLNMTVHGENYKMGGIGFVATYPEYRQQGIIKKLMLQALKEMRQNGQSISVLAPFSVSFYRYFGWELFFEKLHYSIPHTMFPSLGKQLDVVKRMSFEWPDETLFQAIQRFHNTQALVHNGSMLRDEAWWKRIERRASDSHFAAYFQADKIAGYIRYTIQDGTFMIHDFIAEDILAEQAIWRFITSHATSVHTIEGITANDHHFGFQFQEPQFKRDVKMDVMIRIVDACAFMQRYPWREIQEPLYVWLEDDFCTWNECIYRINKDGDVSIIEANSIPDKHMLALPINLFSAMMVGYLSVKDALIYAKKEPVKEVVEQWQKAIPSNRPVFYEYF